MEGKVLKDFREFISKGNVIDLAVAVIIGAAFGAIITSLVNDLLMPLIGVILGGFDVSGLAVQVGEASIAYELFLQATINFLIIAFALFLIVRGYDSFQRKEDSEEPPPPPADEVLLTEIRDLLKEKA